MLWQDTCNAPTLTTFAQILEKYVKIGVVKMVSVPKESAIVYLGIQERTVQKLVVYPLSTTTQVITHAVLAAHQGHIKTFTQ